MANNPIGLLDMLTAQQGTDPGTFTPSNYVENNPMPRDFTGRDFNMDLFRWNKLKDILPKMSTIGDLGTLGIGLASAYNAYQENKLRKDALNYQKGATNRNISNQAVVVNDQLANQAKMQAQMFGNKVGTSEYEDYLARNTKRVDGSAI